MANATFEELFNLSVLDVVVPTATIGFPSPAQDNPYVDDEWLDNLGEEVTDRKLAFFGKVTRLLPILRSAPFLHIPNVEC